MVATRLRRKSQRSVEPKPERCSTFTEWTKSLAHRLWTYSLTPPTSPERPEKQTEQTQPKPSKDCTVGRLAEQKYVLVDRGSLVSLTPSVEESKYSSVPIPSFRKVEQVPVCKSKARSEEDITDDHYYEMHKPMEKTEQREIKRDRELQKYRQYMEKLRKEFPSHFGIAAEPSLNFRRKRRNTE